MKKNNNCMVNQLYKMDCINFMKKCEDEKFDLIIADPPYFRIKGDFDYEWTSCEEYIEWCKEWIQECKRILKPNGSIYIWGKIGYGKGMPFLKLAIWLEEEAGFRIINWITQRNSRGRGNKKGYMEAREELIFAVKSECKTSEFVWNTAYLEEESLRKDLGFDGKKRKSNKKRASDVWCNLCIFNKNILQIQDVWTDISEASQSKNQQFKNEDGQAFPTVKNIEFCDRIINSSSNANDLIYIPFAGSGSEIASAINNNRKWIATEKDEKTYRMALKRIDNMSKSFK